MIVSPALLDACGEKLLTLGRSIRFQSRHTPRAASVLLYLPHNETGRPLTDPNLESALKEAGHGVRAVTTSEELDDALRGGTFDVVLANITDAADRAEQGARRSECRCPSCGLSRHLGSTDEAPIEVRP
jgi:hypothetical protein